jgi:GAF domain-containing protein
MLNLQDVINLVAENVLRLLGAQIAIVNIHDEETGQFTRAVASDPLELSYYLEDYQPRPSGLTKEIMESGRPIAIEDVSRDERVSKAVLERGVKSILGVPVSVAQKVVGTIFVDCTEPRRFAERDITLPSWPPRPRSPSATRSCTSGSAVSPRNWRRGLRSAPRPWPKP